MQKETETSKDATTINAENAAKLPYALKPSTLTHHGHDLYAGQRGIYIGRIDILRQLISRLQSDLEMWERKLEECQKQ